MFFSFFSLNDNKKASSVDADDENTKKPVSRSKMAAWLFDKKTMGAILEQHGFSTTFLFMANSDYSLSVSYLQQTLATLQTVLRFRSPYSNSYDSIVAFNPAATAAANGDANTNVDAAFTSNHHAKNSGTYNNSHSRGFSLTGQFTSSASTNQLGGGGGVGMGVSGNGTPRRSIDADSNTDDGTSYDSMSQISVDQNGMDNNGYLAHSLMLANALH